MSEEQWQKMKFWANKEFEYHAERGYILPCLLMAVDFENGLLKLWPIPNDFLKMDDPDYDNGFWTRYEYVELPKAKLKAV
jgi:hypothetical protein